MAGMADSALERRNSASTSLLARFLTAGAKHERKGKTMAAKRKLLKLGDWRIEIRWWRNTAMWAEKEAYRERQHKIEAQRGSSK